MNCSAFIGLAVSLTFALSAHPDIADVDKDSGGSAYSATGDDLSIESLTIGDGDSLLVVVGSSGTDDDSRVVSSVTLKDAQSVEDDVQFIQVNHEDRENENEGWGIRIEVWKLDNKRFETDDTAYDDIDITFGGTQNERTYAYAYVLDDQNTFDMLRLFKPEEDSDTQAHTVTPFVLESNAMVISGHLYANLTPTSQIMCTGSETEDFDQTVTSAGEGFLVQHALPNAIGTHRMKATTNFAGDSISCAVIIRSDEDIVHTWSPGTLGDSNDPDDGGWWLEGLTRTENGDRGDITDFGDYMHTGKATWWRGAICAGNGAGNNLELGE